MSADLGIFPFGQPVHKVEQADRSPKKVFVLGVYASAVHAKWVNMAGKQKVHALAVASEPAIFWRGDGADEIIGRIEIPPQAGHLMPAGERFNGPSGIALDEFFLRPLNLTRDDCWLCDLLPQAYMNPAQEKAIKRAYLPLVQEFDLPLPTVPKVPKAFSTEQRRAAIKQEIAESGAEVLILLGDQPIKWFLRYYDQRWQKLADFGTAVDTYGKLHQTKLGNTAIEVLPLAHPRQVARLGTSSGTWYDLHQSWLQDGPAQLAYPNVIDRIRARLPNVPEEEVLADVAEAIAAVRSSHKYK